MSEDFYDEKAYIKKIKILEKKLKRSEENRLHTQEMKDKTKMILGRLNEEREKANELIIKRNEELKLMKEKAENLARIKSDFLANMSHEIRTPMNAIIGFANLIERNDVDKKQYIYVKKIEKAAKVLLHLINDILDFSKAESGKLKLEQIYFRLDDVVENIGSVLEIKTAEKGIKFNIIINDNVPEYIVGDPLRLGQILLNLLDNAVKFTSEGEVSLVITLKKESEKKYELFFEIIDDGIGLSEEQIDRLFSAFVQADSSTTRKYGGTGLGLVISKQLCNLMGGDINVESTLGNGSKFYFNAWFDKNVEHDQSIVFVNKEIEQEISKFTRTEKIINIDKNSFDTKLKNLFYFLKEYDSRAKIVFEEISSLIEENIKKEEFNKLYSYIFNYDYEEAYTLLANFFYGRG